jgi:hypothetical protein
MTRGWKRYGQVGIFAAWGIAIIGYFGPWVGRRSAALNLQTLRLPLVGLAVLLPTLLAEVHRAWRIGGALVGAGLALATLPPYPEIVSAWHTPGWRIPFWWGVGAMLAAGAAVWFAPRLRHYRPWILLAWLVVTGLPAAVTFARLLPALRALHAALVGPGWGFWVCMSGLGCIALLLWMQSLNLPLRLSD